MSGRFAHLAGRRICEKDLWASRDFKAVGVSWPSTEGKVRDLNEIGPRGGSGACDHGIPVRVVAVAVKLRAIRAKDRERGTETGSESFRVTYDSDGITGL